MTNAHPFASAANIEEIDRLVLAALKEDVGHEDVTTAATIRPGVRANADFFAKENGVVAGLQVAERVFALLDPAVDIAWQVKDGDAVEAGRIFGTITGPARSILSGERLALNLLQRMSGIATATSRMVALARPFGATILDTRKTAPGLRKLDKWAVLLGAGENHRMGLYDMILIKDNHIAAAGGVAPAIRAAQRYVAEMGNKLRIEVEARTPDEIDEILGEGGVDIVLLDNMVDLSAAGVDTSRLRAAVEKIDGRFKTEASGNVTEETVAAIAATGVDYISCGALTHSVRALDISLKIRLDLPR